MADTYKAQNKACSNASTKSGAIQSVAGIRDDPPSIRRAFDPANA